MSKKYLKTAISSVLIASSIATSLPLNTLSAKEASNFIHASGNNEQSVAQSSSKVKVYTSKVETVGKISKGTVVVGNKSYKFDQSLKEFFSNTSVLKSAKIQFKYDQNRVIKQLVFLELNSSGKASKSEDKTYKNNNILDAKGIVINGNIRVNADYITLKNITASKDLELTNKVKHVFYTSKVTVKGKTITTNSSTVKAAASTSSSQTGKKSLGQSFYKSLSYVAPNSVLATQAAQPTNSFNQVLVFENSKISKLLINQAGLFIQTIGQSIIGEISLGASAIIQNAPSSTISGLFIQSGTNQVTVNGSVNSISVNAHIGHLVLNSNTTVTLGNGAQIDTVTTSSNLLLNGGSHSNVGVLNVNGNVPALQLNIPIGLFNINTTNPNLQVTGIASILNVFLNSLSNTNIFLNIPTLGDVSASNNNNGRIVLGQNTSLENIQSKDLLKDKDQLDQVKKENGVLISNTTPAPPTSSGGGAVIVPNPESFVQTEDFGYWADTGEGRAAYNVGFKLDLAKLSYANLKEIKISLQDENGNTIASRTATGAQITKLQADDLAYGGEDGQLSAAFLQRDSGATNDWWTSTSYNFATPKKAIIQIVDKDNKVYKVEKSNPTDVPANPNLVATPEDFVQTQDFGYWEDAGEGRPAYNVGFKLDLTKLPYDKLKEIKISLLDAGGNKIASRTATGAQITKLQEDDLAYDGQDGQLSAAFIQRDHDATNEWWTSTAYDFSNPASVVFEITDKDNKVYKVENNNPTGIPATPNLVANPESFVQTQDFGYWEDAGEGRPAYNVGFKLDLAKLPYNMLKEIKVSLQDENGQTIASRTASGPQITKLQQDDQAYGEQDGQLSAAFIQRDDEATNDWWTSTAYDFSNPANVVIEITDKDNKVYKVENNNPTGIPASPNLVANPESFVQTQDFGYWDAGAGSPAYNVGFKLDLAKLPYDMLKEIKVSLVDENGNKIASRTATGPQITKLQADDVTYGGQDGQLSAAFLKRDDNATNDWWTSTAYDFSIPTAAVIEITDKDNKVYKVENNQPTGIPVVTVANPENFVQTQDFGYWADAGNGSPAYNVGFKLDVTKLPYNKLKEIKVFLLDENDNMIASRTATGAQITKLQADDVTYGGEDGELSAAFIQRDQAATNNWWTSTAYNFTIPKKAVIQILDKDYNVYTVVNSNVTGVN